MSKSTNWLEKLDAWRASGLSQAEFCRREQISAARFHYYKQKLSKFPEDNFVELKSACSSSELIELALPSGIVMKLPSNTSGSRLHELVQCLS